MPPFLEAFLHLNTVEAHVERYVLMIDAGYLLVQSVKFLSSGTSHKRSELQLKDPGALIAGVIESAVRVMGLGDDRELLRVYWYDGVGSDGLTPTQRQIIDVDDVQLRAGTINGRRQQKGVDSLIVTDLVELATNRAVCDAIVVTGDSDLAVGIEIAQKRGVRIGVLGVEHFGKDSKVTHNISPEITNLADRVGFLDLAAISASLDFVAKESQPSTTVGAIEKGKSKVAKQPRSAMAEEIAEMPTAEAIKQAKAPETKTTQAVAAEQLQPKSLFEAVENYIRDRAIDASVVEENSGRINSQVDRELLAYLKAELGRNLKNSEKVEMRDHFRLQLGRG